MKAAGAESGLSVSRGNFLLANQLWNNPKANVHGAEHGRSDLPLVVS